MKHKEMIEEMEKVTHSELLEWFGSGKNAEDWIVSYYNFDGFSDEEKEKAHADLRVEIVTILTEDLLPSEYPYAALKQMGATSQELQDASAYVPGNQVSIDLSLVAGEWINKDPVNAVEEQIDAVKAKLSSNRKNLLLGIAIGSVATAAVAYCLTRADK